MMQKIIKCGLLGGIVLFIWGLVSWTIVPWQKHQIKTFANESCIASDIQSVASGNGVYVMPNALNSSPRYQGNVAPMIASLLIKILSACLVAWLLLQTRLDRKKIVKFTTLIGVLIAIAALSPYVIWFGFPAIFAISSLVEIVFGWFFAGLAMSRVLT